MGVVRDLVGAFLGEIVQAVVSCLFDTPHSVGDGVGVCYTVHGLDELLVSVARLH